MTLTGKAKDDFEKWLNEGNHTPWIAFFYNLPDTVMNAYYIEWFDSVGIYAIIYPYSLTSGIEDSHDAIAFDGTWSLQVYDKGGLWLADGADHDTRNEAKKSAILTCNDLYNERN